LPFGTNIGGQKNIKKSTEDKRNKNSPPSPLSCEERGNWDKEFGYSKLEIICNLIFVNWDLKISAGVSHPVAGVQISRQVCAYAVVSF
jgi:hypothetical protein